jgi:hypothetical protein
MAGQCTIIDPIESSLHTRKIDPFIHHQQGHYPKADLVVESWVEICDESFQG